MTNTKLTKAQRKALNNAVASKYGRPGACDPRTIAKLLDLGYFELEGHYYGPMYKITDAGRKAVQS